MDNKLENWVIISAIILGLGGGIVLLIFMMPPITVAFFMALGAAALIYKFLGGIPAGSFFSTKLFKLCGTAAVLTALTWFINGQLAKQISPDLDRLFEPQWQDWIAIDKDNYIPIEIQIKGIRINGNNKILAKSGVFDSKELCIIPSGDMFIIRPIQNSNFILGRLKKSDLNGIKYFNQIGRSTGRLYTSGRLTAGTQNAKLRHRLTMEELPFTISTHVYENSISGYSLAGNNNESFYRGELALLGGEVVSWQNENYLIFVLEANHQGGDASQMYTAFGAYKIGLE